MKKIIPILICFSFSFSCNSRVDVTKIQHEVKDTVHHTDSAKSDEMLQKTLEIAKVSVSGDIAEIEAYVSIVLDSASTKTVKYRAFRALHDDYPNAFSSIKNVRQAADRVEAAIIRQAQIKAVKEEIVDINKAKAANK